MPPITPISSLNDPRLADYANLRDRQLAALARGEEPGAFIAEGELVVRQLIDSGFRTRSVLLTPTRLQTIRDALDRLPDQTPVYLAPQDLMNRIVGFNIHRGILAAGIRPEPPDLAQLLRSARTLVILEDLANHDNLGGIFRATAALAGLPTRGPGPRRLEAMPAAILLSPGCCDPLYRKAIRVSMGTALHLPWARVESWPGDLEQVRRAGFTLVALTPDPAATPIDALLRPGRPALLLGAEGPGLSPAALAAADRLIRIPIDRRVDSLNVATAAAIALSRLCPSG
jgi:tRNA G18 (ribose-2'-O)-methylase SpoU